VTEFAALGRRNGGHCCDGPCFHLRAQFADVPDFCERYQHVFVFCAVCLCLCVCVYVFAYWYGHGGAALRGSVLFAIRSAHHLPQLIESQATRGCTHPAHAYGSEITVEFVFSALHLSLTCSPLPAPVAYLNHHLSGPG
ncbi:unnamed protein product, partial [Scytosiphon promiscuus]